MYSLGSNHITKASRLMEIAVVVVILMVNHPLNTQYSLPNLPLLVQNGVRIIHISETPVRMENQLMEQVHKESFSKTPQQLSTYFISSKGRIDSIYFHANDTHNYYKKEVLTYTDNGLLIGRKTVTHTGNVEMFVTVEKTPENEWNYKLWEHGELKKEIKSTKDSITYESVSHRMYDPIHYYSKFIYNLEKDIKTESWYEEEKLLSRQTYQWITTNGIPERIIKTTFSLGEGSEKPKSETQSFKVNEDGMVINSLNGLVFDPFRLDNYFSRHERFLGIVSNHKSLFSNDSLITQIEVSELFSFDGTNIVYLYNFSYE